MESGLRSTVPGPAADYRAALEAALSAYFAHQRFGSLSADYVERSALPGLFLWIHGWHPLPTLLSWVAALAWGGCSGLAFSFRGLAWKWQREFAAALPEARCVARLHMAPRPMAASSVLLHLLLPVSALLWLQAVLPGLLGPGLLAASLRGWPLLLGLSLCVRLFD